MLRPYTVQSRPSSAAVGLTSARSTRDSVERLTSARRANSSSVHPRSTRSSASRSASRSSAAVSIPISVMLSRIWDAPGRDRTAGRKGRGSGPTLRPRDEQLAATAATAVNWSPVPAAASVPGRTAMLSARAARLLAVATLGLGATLTLSPGQAFAAEGTFPIGNGSRQAVEKIELHWVNGAWHDEMAPGHRRRATAVGGCRPRGARRRSGARPARRRIRRAPATAPSMAGTWRSPGVPAGRQGDRATGRQGGGQRAAPPDEVRRCGVGRPALRDRRQARASRRARSLSSSGRWPG